MIKYLAGFARQKPPVFENSIRDAETFSRWTAGTLGTLWTVRTLGTVGIVWDTPDIWDAGTRGTLGTAGHSSFMQTSRMLIQPGYLCL